MLLQVFVFWYEGDNSERWCFAYEPRSLISVYGRAEKVTVIRDEDGDVWLAVPTCTNRTGALLVKKKLYRSEDEFRKDRALAKLTDEDRKALGV